MKSDNKSEERLNNENNYILQHLNMFFIAESMLILAYITSLNVESAVFIRALLNMAGMGVTAIFLVHFIFNSKNLRELEKKVKKEYKSFSTSFNIFMGSFIPLIFFLVWIGFSID